MELVLKDLLKPRYAVVVEVIQMPNPILKKGGDIEFNRTVVPAVTRVPIKRPLSMAFNEFYNTLSKPGNMIICGSKRTLQNMYGIGSCEPHNIAKATMLCSPQYSLNTSTDATTC